MLHEIVLLKRRIRKYKDAVVSKAAISHSLRYVLILSLTILGISLYASQFPLPNVLAYDSSHLLKFWLQHHIIDKGDSIDICPRLNGELDVFKRSLFLRDNEFSLEPLKLSLFQTLEMSFLNKSLK